jgi:hypothetical protein
VDAHLLQAQPGRYSRQQLEEWLYQPGLPAEFTEPRSRNLDAAAAAARAWASGELPVDKLSIRQWSPQATVYFIKALPAGLDSAMLSELDSALGLSGSRNAEIARAWFIEVARRRFEPAYDQMRSHLARYGRTRLVEPVYEALARNGEDRALALGIFEQVRSSYHPLTIAAIQPLLDAGADQ